MQTAFSASVAIAVSRDASCVPQKTGQGLILKGPAQSARQGIRERMQAAQNAGAALVSVLMCTRGFRDARGLADTPRYFMLPCGASEGGAAG